MATTAGHLAQQTTEDLSPAALSAGEVLQAVRAAEAAVRRAEADKLALALRWAHLHPSVDGTQNADDAAMFFSQYGEAPISGDGCPGVAEFAIAEFGAVLGTTTNAAKTMIGQALELFHRLPRCWARVQSGVVPAWRARKVADATIHAVPELTAEAAAWIDAQTAPFLDKVGPAQIERIIEQAKLNFNLAATADDEDAEPDQRRVDIRTRDLNLSGDGTVFMEARLDLADALDLEQALRAGAEELKALGSEEALDVRRSQALGHMARRQLALDLSGGDVERAESTPARRVVLNLHFDASIHPDGQLGVAATGRLDHAHHVVALHQVKSWLNTSHTDVRIQPVIDLNTEITSAGYVPSPRLRRQVELRDKTCVFPWCNRRAAASDLDHTVPYDRSAGRDAPDDPPQTRTSNLGALCRTHHRLKTDGQHRSDGWKVTQPQSGVFVWDSPHGHVFLRDRYGTHVLEPEPDPSGVEPSVPG